MIVRIHLLSNVLCNSTRVTFLSTSEVSVVFDISSSHANANLPSRIFYMNNF